ncbi:MAG: hypothetical protein AAB343_03920 [Patescibacteria group bacterium]
MARLLIAALCSMLLVGVLARETLAQPDRLSCFRVKDSQLIGVGTDAIYPDFDPPFPIQDCFFKKGKIKKLCVPSETIHLNGAFTDANGDPYTPAQMPGGVLENLLACYKVKCNVLTTFALDLKDDMGERTVTVSKVHELCYPAYQPSTTTTSTSTTTTTM